MTLQAFKMDSFLLAETFTVTFIDPCLDDGIFEIEKNLHYLAERTIESYDYTGETIQINGSSIFSTNNELCPIQQFNCFLTI